MCLPFYIRLPHGKSPHYRIVLIVEDGVEYLVANGVSDLEKFNTDDISLSVNPKGSLSRRLDQDQMVGCFGYFVLR